MEYSPLIDDNLTLDGLNILIADDEEINYMLMSEYLDETGANILYAGNGKEAVDLCKKNNIDLVLMDIRMPVMDGIDATIAIKELKNVPVIAVSAFTLEIQKDEKRILKFDDYIEKPVRQKILRDHILAVMKGHQN